MRLQAELVLNQAKAQKLAERLAENQKVGR